MTVKIEPVKHTFGPWFGFMMRRVRLTYEVGKPDQIGYRIQFDFKNGGYRLTLWMPQ